MAVVVPVLVPAEATGIITAEAVVVVVVLRGGNKKECFCCG